jgi:uncharacterized protein DUF992
MMKRFLIAIGLLGFISVNVRADDLPTRYAPPPEINGVSGNKVGVLTCTVYPSIGLVVASAQKIDCRFVNDNSGTVELYTGMMGNLGLDLGFTVAGVLVWGVYAPTKDIQPGSLAGAFGGASVRASAVLGAGANFLIGGSLNSVALQPLSVEGLAGVRATLGLQNMELKPVGGAPLR